jgi:hypothetical protein
MAERPPPGWTQESAGARPPSPSGLFPGAPLRPFYREAHPVGAAAVLAGMGSGLLWFALFGSIGRDLVGYAWWTLAAAVSAWLVALILTVLGDRGVAVGVAIVSGIGWSVAMGFVAVRWITANDWPMW